MDPQEPEQAVVEGQTQAASTVCKVPVRHHLTWVVHGFTGGTMKRLFRRVWSFNDQEYGLHMVLEWDADYHGFGYLVYVVRIHDDPEAPDGYETFEQKVVRCKRGQVALDRADGTPVSLSTFYNKLCLDGQWTFGAKTNFDAEFPHGDFILRVTYEGEARFTVDA